jgi:hypothetical protein
MHITYCDDLTILGTKSNINETMTKAMEIVERFGYRVNKSKSQIITLSTGADILGIPSGNKEYLDNRFDKLLEEIRQLTALIENEHISAYARIMFLKYCINTIPVFFVRAVQLNEEQLGQIDSIIDDALCKTASYNGVLPEWSKLARDSLGEGGGLGIHRYSGGFASIHYDNLRVKMNDAILAHNINYLKAEDLKVTNLSLGYMDERSRKESETTQSRRRRLQKAILNNNLKMLRSSVNTVAIAPLVLSSAYNGACSHISTCITPSCPLYSQRTVAASIDSYVISYTPERPEDTKLSNISIISSIIFLVFTLSTTFDAFFC